jgi:hypothetical protein|tara:strand:- start:490 stop:1380 length:891 start_codon:yes stop_codon:yes gene_type:complete
MGAIGFICPDKQTTSFEHCFEKCRMAERCMSVATLKAMSEQRPDNRPPSTTELLVGTCESYLKRTTEYYINPQERAYALMGTIHHENLEKQDLSKDKYLIEHQLEGLDITGILDFYDKETETLIDYKNTGSFKAMKVLGMTHTLVPDPSGARYKRSGKWGKAGQIKQVKQWYRDDSIADFGDWLLQINMYRYLLEQEGYKVRAQKLQMNIRDASTAMSRDRGIDRNIYFVDVPFVDDDELVEFYIHKRDLLLEHLVTKTTPAKCNIVETWEGKKCEAYCEVRSLCPYTKNILDINK